MISFNEYHENISSGGAVGQNILPAALVSASNSNQLGGPAHNLSVGNNRIDNLDQVQQVKHKSMSMQ